MRIRFVTMNNMRIVITCIQVFICVCLVLCNNRIVTRPMGSSDGFLCKGHDCGCKSEYNCRTDCCCFPKMSYDGYKEGKNSLGIFINSINCKYGNHLFPGTSLIGKYILECQSMIEDSSCVSILTDNLSVFIPQIMASPPEKPPRYVV